MLDPKPYILDQNCPDILAEIWGLRIRVPRLLSGVLLSLKSHAMQNYS